MDSFRKLQLELFKYFEKLESEAERNIIRAYQGTLIDLKHILADTFEKYEEDGVLTYAEMIRYGRLHKLNQHTASLEVKLYQTTTKAIEDTLTTTYKNAFNQTEDILKDTLGRKSLIGIIREDELQKALTSEISGLKWAERMDLRKDQALLKLRETLVQGLYNGESYKQMAERLNLAIGKDVPNAVRIMRVESHRVFSEAKKDRLDRIQGVALFKEWITSGDEAVRSNHVPMNGVKVPYKQNFRLPNGNEGFAPCQIGATADDCNCRCDWVVDTYDDKDKKKFAQSVDFGDKSGIIELDKTLDEPKGETMKLLPRYEEAVIPIEKFTKYALDYEKDPNKAQVFEKVLGYNQSNADKLIENIKSNIHKFEAVEREDIGHGVRYQVTMTLTGETGRSAKVLTAWIDDNKNGQMRLTSAYIDR